MEAKCSFETLVHIRTTLRYIPEICNIHTLHNFTISFRLRKKRVYGKNNFRKRKKKSKFTSKWPLCELCRNWQVVPYELVGSLMMMNVQQSGAITDADLLHQRDASAPPRHCFISDTVNQGRLMGLWWRLLFPSVTYGEVSWCMRR
jgi:hypothetical protein